MASFPPYREDLRKAFGYVSFHCQLANLDLVGIRSKKTNEVIAIFYRGATKVGYLYEGGRLSEEVVFKVYQDVPKNYNDLDDWADTMGNKIEVMIQEQKHYVFLSDKEVIDYRKLKQNKKS